MAEEMSRQLSGLGFSVAPEIEEVGQHLTNPEGPWKIHVLEADPRKVRVEIAHAYDAAIGLETTADLAGRHGALAAINGGYFRMKGLLAGDNQGTLQLDGRLLSEPDRGRAAVGFFEEDGVSRAVFGRLSFAAKSPSVTGRPWSSTGSTAREGPPRSSSSLPSSTAPRSRLPAEPRSDPGKRPGHRNPRTATEAR